jgi:hypothetical protein
MCFPPNVGLHFLLRPRSDQGNALSRDLPVCSPAILPHFVGWGMRGTGNIIGRDCQWTGRVSNPEHSEYKSEASVNAWASFLDRKRVGWLMWVHNDTQEDRKFKVGEVTKEGVGVGVGGLHRVRNWLHPTSGGDRTTDALIFFLKIFLSRSSEDHWITCTDMLTSVR